MYTPVTPAPGEGLRYWLNHPTTDLDILEKKTISWCCQIIQPLA